MDLVIDALDNLAGRFLLAETAKRMRVPFIHAAATGWWGQVSTFLPESFLDMHSVYGHGEEQDQPDEVMGVLGWLLPLWEVLRPWKRFASCREETPHTLISFVILMEKADEWMSFISNRGCPDKLLSFRLDYTLFQVWINHLFVTYGRRWHPPIIVPRHHNRIVR